MTEIYLNIPAKEDFLHLLRTVVGSAAARAAFSLDAIDDLRIAVDEAAAYLLGGRARASHLSLKVDLNPEGISALVWSDAEAEWPPQNYEDSLAWKVLSGLTDGASFVREGDHPAVALKKHRPE